jgi:RHS repeat-associated protein
MPMRPIFKLLQVSLFFLLVQFGVVSLAHAQNPITLQGRVLFSTGQPATGATVTMTKSFYDVSPPVTSTETTVTDGGGNYSFDSEGRCAVEYHFQAVSTEIVDDEPLPPANGSVSGCVLSNYVIDLEIARPAPITLGGFVTDDQTGRAVQGITVTMTRTKYDLQPNGVTTATTTTDGSGHYQFPTFSRCAVVEAFRASLGSYTFAGGVSTSGCVLSSNNNLPLTANFNKLMNAGLAGCNTGVGRPVNVTNGNMYLQQTDYQLPGAGEAIAVSRTYNSISQNIGLFGRGWSTMYDETMTTLAGNLLQLTLPDGWVVTSLSPEFYGQMVRNGDDSYTVTFKDGGVHQFSASGKLLSLTDRQGNQMLLTYTNGTLSSITDPFARVLTVTTNGSGRVLSLTDSLGTVATYTYGGSNELLTTTYADNSGYTYSYTGIPGGLGLTAVTDALGNIVEQHDYDSQGRATTSEAQGGVNRYALSYISLTETDVTDALGHVTKYFYGNIKGRLVVTRVEGLCNCGGGSGSQVQTWTYDDKLNVTAKTDALNHVVSFTYDANGNRLTETDSLGTTTYTYNGLAEVLTATDKLNGVTTNTYDSSGNLLTTRDALNNTTTLTYNSRGQVLMATDARGKVTTLTYDTVGNLTQSKDANNITTFYFYDARSRLTKVRDGLSRNTLYAYDAAGRINKATHPDNSFVSFTYDLAGRRTTVTDERGNPTSYAYDSAYRLSTVTDALSHATSYGYDAMSNLTSTTDALSRVTNYEYDDFNRLKKIVYPPATAGATRLFETMAYDAAGNVTERFDTAGRVATYAYDNVNRLASTTDADNKTTGFEYDALSRTTAVIDALNQHYQFAYDALSRQTGMTRGGASMSYQYDAVGNRTQRTDYNGTVTNYAYDSLNRLTTITYPTRTATYAYDPLSNLTRATNENGSVYVSYDNRYRLSTVTDPFYYGVSYNYDTAGNRTKLSLNYATYATYTYDAANRMTNLKDSANQSFPHNYDAVNRLTSRSAPNGVTTSETYDGLDRLTALTHATATATLISNQYQYNDANNISSWANASGNHAYSYDPVDRLTAATNSAQPNENYSFDGVGNRTASHLSANYAYQPFNKLTSTAASTYTYDNNGNLLSKTDASGTTNFTWNEENQLTQVALPNGLTVNYKYDGLGRRIQRTTSAGANERYVYDGHDVLLDLKADWSVATTYLNGPGIDNHLRQASATTGVSYYLADHLGSTSALTDTTGAVVEQLTYDSFGNSAGSTRTRYGYTGRERDPDTGPMYYRARWYDLQVGRFIGEDPTGFDGGLNWYAYVASNPINAIDPLGLDILVIEQGPHGNNPFGHTAIAITGRGVFSFGNGREMATDRKGNIMGGNVADYIDRESQGRVTNLLIIKTTPAQDAAIEAALRAMAQNEPALPQDKSIALDNCSTRSNRALDAGNVTDTGLWPAHHIPGSAGTRAVAGGSSVMTIPQGGGWLPMSLEQFMPKR